MNGISYENLTFCLSFLKWCNTYTLAEKIKALEHQTFSTHFTSKFMLFWITQKLTFFTHPNIKIAKNGNAPIHWRGFHAFFKNSWPSPPPKISHIVTSFICNSDQNIPQMIWKHLIGSHSIWDKTPTKMKNVSLHVNVKCISSHF